jgi:hypothetical protein
MDANGFIKGGGVGMVRCPQFLNAMATARQNGGMGTLAGVKLMQGYMMYVAGFQTGFNSQADGVYDIFSSLGDDAVDSVLYAVEPWCASNPGKTFSDGLLDLASKLQTSKKR